MKMPVLPDAAPTSKGELPMSDLTKQKAREAAEAIRETGKAALNEVRDTAQETAKTVRETAGVMREQAGEAAGTMRRSAADTGEKVASAIRDRAEQQDDDSVQRRLLESVAGGMDSLSHRVREGSLSQLVADAEGFARRNPLLFVAGAALAGFAIARMTQGRSDHDEAM
jgi:ElaB/YqjD/DUF883 family membrane-anchored ribosome-binding protein